MKVAYTDEALRDLDETLDYISTNYPTVLPSFEERLRAVVARIGAWPRSAQTVAGRPNVRVVPLMRYPYKVFYRVTSDAVEILCIQHAARRPPWEQDG